MKAEFKTITPKLAAEILGYNESNRKMRPRKVEQYCRDMRNGRFATTHQGIGIYDNGLLADGQHRLMAIVKTGIPVKMLIVSGIPYEKDTILAIDSGSGRTVTDSSMISGEKVAAKDKAVCIWLANYDGSFQDRTGRTHHEIVEVAEKFSDEIEFINELFPKNVRAITITPVKVAFCKAWSDGVSERTINKLASYLKSGMPFDECDKYFVQLRDDLLTRKHNSGKDSDLMQKRVYNMLVKLDGNS